MAAGIAREQLLAPGVVIGETACRQHHGLGADQLLALWRRDPRPAHLATLDQQAFGRRRRLQVHTQVLCRFSQARHQCHTVDQVHGPTMAGQVVQVAAKALAHVQQGFGRAGHVEEGGKVGTGHDRHAHERGFAHGLAQAWQQGANLAGIVGRGDHLVAAKGCAWRIAMHVRDAVAVGKLQRRVLLEKRHHMRARLKEGIDALGIVVCPQLMAQISPRLFDVFLDAGPARQRVAWHPGPAAGPGGGTAKHRFFLRHDHLLPMPGSRDGRRQPGGARTYDQYIAFGFERSGRHCGFPVLLLEQCSTFLSAAGGPARSGWSCQARTGRSSDIRGGPSCAG